MIPDLPRATIRWQRLVLICAGLHCLLWGLFILALPAQSAIVYGFAHVPQELYLWRGSGLFILLLGIGFALASRNPLQHWVVVLVGLLAKILGATGILVTVLQGQLAVGVLWLLPWNDLIWCWPLAMIVGSAVRHERTTAAGRPASAG